MKEKVALFLEYLGNFVETEVAGSRGNGSSCEVSVAQYWCRNVVVLGVFDAFLFNGAEERKMVY